MTLDNIFLHDGHLFCPPPDWWSDCQPMFNTIFESVYLRTRNHSTDFS